MSAVMGFFCLVFLVTLIVKYSGPKFGRLNAAMICPHCDSKGRVQTKRVNQKKGMSGGKATAALLTGGASLFVAGLSRKEKATQARCKACKNVWFF
jgi:hypothetical protein